VLMRASAFDGVGRYSQEPEYCCVEDYELWSRLCPAGTCANLTDPLMAVKCRRGGIGERHAERQRFQTEAVSRRAMAAVFGADDWRPDFWPAVQRFLDSSASKETDLDASEAALAISALERLHARFSRTYNFPIAELRRHRRQALALWGRHCLRLGVRPNGVRTLTSRASLVAAGTGLLSKAAYFSVA